MLGWSRFFYFLLSLDCFRGGRRRKHLQENLPFYYLLIASAVLPIAVGVVGVVTFYYLLIASRFDLEALELAVPEEVDFLLSLDCFLYLREGCPWCEMLVLSTIS